VRQCNCRTNDGSYKAAAMRIHLHLPLLLLGLGLLTPAASARAAGSVELELLGDVRGAAMLFQEWSQLLGKAGISNVRFRTVDDLGRPGIDIQGAAERPVYVVTGIVRSRDELELPGRRFRRGELGQLAQWLKDLAERGPAGMAEKKGAFGLSAAELEQVRKDLAESVGFDAKGMARREVVEKIAGQLKFPLRLDAETARALGDDKVEDVFSDLSRGTVLACVLRTAGYGLVPRRADGRLDYTAAAIRPNVETWPIGRESEKPPVEVMPALYEFRNINVQNISAAAAIVAIAERLKAPVLLDHYALARHGIDPGKVTVSHPNRRTTYSRALGKLLFQARLKFEVRSDEAGEPFLWISTLKSI